MNLEMRGRDIRGNTVGDIWMDRLETGLRRCFKKVEPRGINLVVKKRGYWFVLTGKVLSQKQRATVIKAVPPREGAQWIVDRIRVS